MVMSIGSSRFLGARFQNLKLSQQKLLNPKHLLVFFRIFVLNYGMMYISTKFRKLSTVSQRLGILASCTSIGTASSRELRGIGLPVIASQRWNSDMKVRCILRFIKKDYIVWGKPPIFRHQIKTIDRTKQLEEPLVPTSFGIDSLGALLLLKQHRRAKPRTKHVETCHSTRQTCDVQKDIKRRTQ